jgi:hypothetical protein
MSNLDPRTIHWKRPRSLDGRRYPLFLREYEDFDGVILPVVAELQRATFNEIADRLDWKAAYSLSHWLMSAEWRGLIESRDPTQHGPMTWVLGPRAAIVLGRAA